MYICRWIKNKTFTYHPTEGNAKAEWDKCIKAIDTKNRAVKRKQSYQSESNPSEIVSEIVSNPSEIVSNSSEIV